MAHTDILQPVYDKMVRIADEIQDWEIRELWIRGLTQPDLWEIQAVFASYYKSTLVVTQYMKDKSRIAIAWPLDGQKEAIEQKIKRKFEE